MTKAEGIPETPGAVGGASSGTALARAGAPIVRPRRLRQSAAMRRQMRELRVDPAELILPMFVREGIDEPREIGSMPGVFQHTEDSLRAAAEEAASLGVGGIMLFGVPETRDEYGSAATSPDGILNRATRALAADLGNDIVIQTDLCLDEFTSHGHCGVLAADGSVDNDATLERYAEMAIAQAEATKQASRTSSSSPTRRSTRPRCTAPSARPSTRSSRATAAPTRWTPPTVARACAKRCLTSKRVPTSSW